MKPSTLRMLTLCSALTVATLALAQDAAQPAASKADRARFIQEFKRTGLNLAPEDATLTRVVIQAHHAKRGVEVGSFTGYGAVQMGMAFEANGGQLFTLEIDPEAVKACRANLAKVGLEKTVTCVEGDALKTIPELQGTFDFVLIDAKKEDYLKYLQAIEPKLAPDAVVVADNVIQSADKMKDYLEYVQKSGAYETVVVRASDEKKDGMAISVRQPKK